MAAEAHGSTACTRVGVRHQCAPRMASVPAYMTALPPYMAALTERQRQWRLRAQQHWRRTCGTSRLAA
eukprot:2907738-Rhodomonas_salina.1